MKCPYKKRIKVYPDGLGRITEVEFMDCDRLECPFWGVIHQIWNIDKAAFEPDESGCTRMMKYIPVNDKYE